MNGVAHASTTGISETLQTCVFADGDGMWGCSVNLGALHRHPDTVPQGTSTRAFESRSLTPSCCWVLVHSNFLYQDSLTVFEAQEDLLAQTQMWAREFLDLVVEVKYEHPREFGARLSSKATLQECTQILAKLGSSSAFLWNGTLELSSQRELWNEFHCVVRKLWNVNRGAVEWQVEAHGGVWHLLP